MTLWQTTTPLEGQEQEIEFTDRQLEQLDAIDNSVYQTILTFLNKTKKSFRGICSI